MAGYRMHPSILREYDIRGVVGETLTTDDALALGRAFGSFVAARGGRTVALGEDGRVSSPALASRFAEGLSATGMAVFRIGLGPTPMLYYAGKSLGADGAVMVTGSHNPPDQNGFKMVVKGAAIYGDDIRKLGEIAQAGAFASGAGRVVERPVMEAYLDRLLHDVDVGRPLTIAWDAGNGATGALLDKLCANLPAGISSSTGPSTAPSPLIIPTQQCRRPSKSCARLSYRSVAISAWPSTATAIASALWTMRARSCGATRSWSSSPRMSSASIPGPRSSPM